MWRKINRLKHHLYPAGIIAAVVFAFCSIFMPSQLHGEDMDGATITAPLADRSHAMQAYLLALKWVRGSQVPASADQSIPITRLFGVRITLRMHTMMVARSDAYVDELDRAVSEPGYAADAAELLRSAVDDALGQVRTSLANARLKAVRDGWLAQVDRVTELEDIAHRLLIDIQLGYDLEPVHIADAAPDDFAVTDAFVHGWHGLRVVADRGQNGSFSWPATSLAGNISAKNQLVQLLIAEGLNHRNLVRLGRSGGPVLQRFKVLHYVKPLLDIESHLLVRGNDVLPPQSMDQMKLAFLAERITDHLQRRFISNGEVRGTYHPTSDRYDPERASDEDISLGAYAIIRQCRLLISQGRDDDYIIDNARRAMESIERLAEQQLSLYKTNPRAVQPAICALSLLSFIDSPLIDSSRDKRNGLSDLLQQLYEPVSGFRLPGEPGVTNGEYVNQATSAVIIASLAGMYEVTLDSELGNRLLGMTQWFWTWTEGNPNISSLQWYAAAHERAGDLLVRQFEEEAAAELKEQQRDLAGLVDAMLRYQIIEPPEIGPDDVLGGFDFGLNPDPDWRSAQMLGFLAVAIRHKGILTHGDRFGWLLSASLAARFIDQLSMHQSNCYYVRSLDDTLGGVRLSLVDNRLSPASSAVALLAVTELQESLTEMDQQE